MSEAAIAAPNVEVLVQDVPHTDASVTYLHPELPERGPLIGPEEAAYIIARGAYIGRIAANQKLLKTLKSAEDYGLPVSTGQMKHLRAGVRKGRKELREFDDTWTELQTGEVHALLRQEETIVPATDAVLNKVPEDAAVTPSQGEAEQGVTREKVADKTSIKIPKQRTDNSSHKTKRTAARVTPSIEVNVEYPADGEDAESVDEYDQEAPVTDSVRLYLNSIGKVALLNAEQEVDLAKRIEAGLFAGYKLEQAAAGANKLSARMKKDLEWIEADGSRAKNHMLEANLRLAVSLAKRYQGKGLSLLDLIQEGNLGLVRAVEKFDYTKGYKFSTYATWWVRQALQRAVADQGRTIRVPVHMVEQINKALRVKRDLAAELDREPTFTEIGEVTDMSGDRVEEILKYGREPVSLETPVGDDGTALFGDFIEDADAVDATEAVDFGLLQDKIHAMLKQLPSREAAILALRFGLTDGQPRTLEEVGNELGVTRERIRQIESKLLKALRKPGSPAQPLKAFTA